MSPEIFGQLVAAVLTLALNKLVVATIAPRNRHWGRMERIMRHA